MVDKLADARRSLEKAKEAAKRRLQEIETERTEIKASLKSLDAAIRALTSRKAITAKPSTNQVDWRRSTDDTDDSLNSVSE